MLPWIAGKNLYAMLALVAVGGLIVTGLYTAGQRAERNKQAAETAKVNTVIVEDRGKDEAEIAAADKTAKEVDAAVASGLRKTFILDEETARLLRSVR